MHPLGTKDSIPQSCIEGSDEVEPRFIMARCRVRMVNTCVRNTLSRFSLASTSLKALTRTYQGRFLTGAPTIRADS